MAAADYQVSGRNPDALFSLKVHRGDGMALLAMNWKQGKPPADFVGFAIEYKEPGGDRFFALQNRLCFPRRRRRVDPHQLSTTLSPIQKFRWVHFPRNAELAGEFLYRVTPGLHERRGRAELRRGAGGAIELRRETYPGQLNVAFTRGFVSSQAFVDRYESAGPISTLLPAERRRRPDVRADAPEGDRGAGVDGLRGAQRHPRGARPGHRRQEGAGARRRLRPQRARHRLAAREARRRGCKVIIDDSARPRRARVRARRRPKRGWRRRPATTNVKRQHMGKLQHNKTIVGRRPEGAGGRLRLDQLQLARVLRAGQQRHRPARAEARSKPFRAAFDGYWDDDSAPTSATPPSAQLADLGSAAGSTRSVAFSPHATTQRAARDDRERHRDEHHVDRCSTRWRSCTRRRARSATRSRRSPTTRRLRLRHLRQEGRRPRRAEAGRQHRAGAVPRR